jgi:hypothetical protein
MSETGDATTPKASVAGTAATGETAQKAAEKPPVRPVAEIRADIFKERAALGASFEELRAELDEAVDAGRARVAGVGRKAKIVAPVAGATLAVALYLRSRVRAKR